MSAANCPETPRQKMIGMMYLFLTAMLAINVSPTVLDAFTKVSASLSKSNENLSTRVDALYGEFEKQYELNPTKTGEFRNQALEVRDAADKLFDHVDSLKLELVLTADGPEGRVDSIGSKDNTDVPGQIMILNGKGKKLKADIEEYRTLLLSFLDENAVSLRKSLEDNLDTSKPKGTTWESENFEHIPLAATITLMTKMQGDIRNSENSVVTHLLGMIDAADIKVNKIKPYVIANSNYIIKGNEYCAQIMVAASDSTQQPVVKLSNGRKLPIKHGCGIYKIKTDKVGTFDFSGIISIMGPDGKLIPYKFNSDEYQVVEPSATISPTKMNVFYAGIENPVSISAPGVSQDQIIAQVMNGNGKLVKVASGYTIKPTKVGKICRIAVMAEIEGNKQTLKTMDFRVKAVPDPVAKIGGKKQGVMGKSQLLAQRQLYAELENFEFDMKFKVVNFNMETYGSMGNVISSKSTNEKLTRAQKQNIKNLKRGSKVYFTDIQAKGPDGKLRTLPPIVLTVK